MVYVRCVSIVCSSVCPICRPLQQRAAGLLLRARVSGDIDQLLHGQRPAATAPQQHAGQQQRIAYAVSVLRRCVSDVCLYQGQRAWQQQSRAAAGDAHRRLHMTRGRVNFGPTNTVRRVATVLLRRSDCVGITDCVSTEGKAIGRVRLSVCFRSILF